MTRDLSRLFRPRSIAVIGGGWGLEVVAQCKKMGFDGEIWPVHPTRAEMHGIACFRSIEDLPGAPDASFIGVNRHLTIEAVRALSARDAGGAVCFASGFAEAEDGREAGAALQEALVIAAGDMPVLGPNCYGVINYLDGALLWPDQHGGIARESGVALLTQSSNILINFTMAARGLPIAYVMAAGNQAQTTLADMAMACLDDPRVTAVGLYIEGVKDVRAFEAMAAKARALGKPIVALKAGRSEEAQRATLSHTASLAGSDSASRAFLQRLSIPVLGDIPEFLETLKLLHIHGPIAGREICSVSCSGGEASLAGDAAVGRAVTYRPMTEAQRDSIQETLSPLVTVSNPLDYHTFIWGDAARMTATFTAVLECRYDLTMFIFDFPRGDRCSDTTWSVALDRWRQRRRRLAQKWRSPPVCPRTCRKTGPKRLPAAASRRCRGSTPPWQRRKPPPRLQRAGRLRCLSRFSRPRMACPVPFSMNAWQRSLSRRMGSACPRVTVREHPRKPPTRQRS